MAIILKFRIILSMFIIMACVTRVQPKGPKTRTKKKVESQRAATMNDNKKTNDFLENTAFVDRLFVYHLPGKKTPESQHSFKLSSAGNNDLPTWLHFKEKHMMLYGIPGDADVGKFDLHLKETSAHSVKRAAREHEADIRLTINVVSRNTWTGAVKTRGLPENDSCQSTVVNFVLSTHLKGMTKFNQVDLMQKASNLMKKRVLDFRITRKTFKDVASSSRQAQKHTRGRRSTRKTAADDEPVTVFSLVLGCTDSEKQVSLSKRLNKLLNSERISKYLNYHVIDIYTTGEATPTIVASDLSSVLVTSKATMALADDTSPNSTTIVESSADTPKQETPVLTEAESTGSTREQTAKQPVILTSVQLVNTSSTLPPHTVADSSGTVITDPATAAPGATTSSSYGTSATRDTQPVYVTSETTDYTSSSARVVSSASAADGQSSEVTQTVSTPDTSEYASSETVTENCDVNVHSANMTTSNKLTSSAGTTDIDHATTDTAGTDSTTITPQEATTDFSVYFTSESIISTDETTAAASENMTTTLLTSKQAHSSLTEIVGPSQQTTFKDQLTTEADSGTANPNMRENEVSEFTTTQHLQPTADYRITMNSLGATTESTRGPIEPDMDGTENTAGSSREVRSARHRHDTAETKAQTDVSTTVADQEQGGGPMDATTETAEYTTDALQRTDAETIGATASVETTGYSTGASVETTGYSTGASFETTAIEITVNTQVQSTSMDDLTTVAGINEYSPEHGRRTRDAKVSGADDDEQSTREEQQATNEHDEQSGIKLETTNELVGEIGDEDIMSEDYPTLRDFIDLILRTARESSRQ